MKLNYRKEGSIVCLGLNRPEAPNALDDDLRLETINGYSSVGDFSEVRRRLATFFDKNR